MTNQPGMPLPPMTFGQMMAACPRMHSEISQCDPIASASLVASLLSEPSLHANNERLEVLIHLLVGFASGKKIPRVTDLNRWLNKDLKTINIDLREDPPEDVFIASVGTDEGDWCILMGTWTSQDFYLQRVLNVIKTLPPEHRLLHRSVAALLKLSDRLIERLKLPRNGVGGGGEGSVIDIPKLPDLKKRSVHLKFTASDLQEMGINPDELRPFIFRDSSKMPEEIIGRSSLIDRPVLFDGLNWYLVLPTAVGAAVRQFIFSWIIGNDLVDSFDNHVAIEYRRTFCDLPILGRCPPEEAVQLRKHSNVNLIQYGVKIDSKRLLFILGVVHKLELKEDSYESMSRDIQEALNEVNEQAKGLDVQEICHFIVDCGFGESRRYALSATDSADRWYKRISCPDLCTLVWDNRANPYHLWKLAEQLQRVSESGVAFKNLSGLLNLYGWWQGTRLLWIPDDVEVLETMMFFLPTNLHRDVRARVRTRWNVHNAQTPEGKYEPVRNFGKSFFDDDGSVNTYLSVESDYDGELRVLIQTETVILWLEAERANANIEVASIDRILDALLKWLSRGVQTLERFVPAPPTPARVVLSFANAVPEEAGTSVSTAADFGADVVVRQSNMTIYLSLSGRVIGAFNRPDNFAERKILKHVLVGLASLFQCDFGVDVIDSYLDEIVPNEDARFMHVLQVEEFRDYMQVIDEAKSIVMEDADAKKSLFGLGWLVNSNRKIQEIHGAAECVKTLNSVVDALWKRIQSRLTEFNRKKLIMLALRAMEGNEREKRIWEISMRAVYSLRGDADSVKEVAVGEVGKFTANSVALRILIEMAVCECPIDSGANLGMIDIHSLMSDAYLIFSFGGWSEAMFKEVMEPRIRVAGNGDIQTNPEFWDTIAIPHSGRRLGQGLDSSAETYEQFFQAPPTAPTPRAQLGQEFFDAYTQEFGFTIEDLRSTSHALEDLAIERKECVFAEHITVLADWCQEKRAVAAEVGRAVIGAFSLWPKEKWDMTPPGFSNRDWFPWQFSRRLSLVSRPLVRLDNSENPLVAVSPALFGDSIRYTVRRYFEGTVLVSDCRSAQMRDWVNKRVAERGHRFVLRVRDAVAGLGWSTDIEITLPKLLGRQLDKDYGDIDVLAWNSATSRVLLIECKNLGFARTYGEIAEQLNRFAGKQTANGKDDELLKHLNRYEFLLQEKAEVAKYLSLDQGSIQIECIVCFSDLIPMQYVAHRFPKVRFMTIDEIEPDL